MLSGVVSVIGMIRIFGTFWTRTDVEVGTVGPRFGQRVKSITVLQALLPTGVRPSHNIEFVVQGADTLETHDRNELNLQWIGHRDATIRMNPWRTGSPALQRFVLSSGT